MRIKLLLALALCLALKTAMPLDGMAQNVALSTNLAGLANFGTMNLEASMSVARHWTVNAGVRYNPFSFGGGEDGNGGRQYRQRSVNAGARYWPWHIYSGWWAAAKAQYQEYNTGGFYSPETREGDRYGAGLSLGYSHMLGTHFNVEIGAGLWGGMDNYVLYSCPTCGRILERGNATFVMLNEVLLSLSYIF